MSYLPNDLFRLRRMNPSKGMWYSARTLGLVLMTVFALCARDASARSIETYTLSTNGPISVQAGHFAPFTVTVTPTGGNVTGNMSITCGNLPVYSQCEFPESSSSLAMNNAPASITVSFNTSQVYNFETKNAPHHSALGRAALCLLFAPAIGLVVLGRKRGLVGNSALRVVLFVVALCPMIGLAGCANNRPQSTPAGSYTIALTGSIGNTTEGTTMVINVTP